jgi:hypothetical protein
MKAGSWLLAAAACAACSSSSAPGTKDAAVDQGDDVGDVGDANDTGAAGAGDRTCGSNGAPCSSTMPCCAPMFCAGTCSMGVSDRALKRDFAAVDDDAVLRALVALPVSTWRYSIDDPATRHIGPTAQDFRSAFHVGPSDKVIYQVDGDGVAFAAIKSLNARVARLDEENASLRRELEGLRAELRRAPR